MRTIWTPWRMAYITTADKGECVFCRHRESTDDASSFIVSRARSVFTVLNIFPYTAGHLMVCPYRHVGFFGELTEIERRELFLESRRAAAILDRVYRPDSLHVGANIGRPAGAGVLGHLHLHLVPFREADGLGLPLRAGIDDPPESIEETYRKVRAEAGAR